MPDKEREGSDDIPLGEHIRTDYGAPRYTMPAMNKRPSGEGGSVSADPELSADGICSSPSGLYDPTDDEGIVAITGR